MFKYFFNVAIEYSFEFPEKTQNIMGFSWYGALKCFNHSSKTNVHSLYVKYMLFNLSFDIILTCELDKTIKRKTNVLSLPR